MVDFLDWLQVRYPADREFRSEELERLVLSFLNTDRKAVKIMDVGSGLAFNFRYFYPLIRSDQKWIFLDLDRDLLTRATNLAKDLVNRETGSHNIVIEPKHVSLLSAAIEQYRVDVVMANAVFDLFSAKQFEQFLTHQQGKVLYLTTNYTGMAFEPSLEEDRYFIGLYHDHMQRTQSFGRAMGPSCGKEMREILLQQGFAVKEQRSDWDLTDHPKISLYLLEFVQSAVGDILPRHKVKSFENWLTRRRKSIRNDEVKLIVRHSDILACHDETIKDLLF